MRKFLKHSALPQQAGNRGAFVHDRNLTKRQVKVRAVLTAEGTD